ncbi:MAG: uridine 5'-monophosphate synthase isoform [Parachlamydiales bacterium]|nr:uridine 5'-monophosphate synthase isoform [Parachlamydiales bacterium]
MENRKWRDLTLRLFDVGAIRFGSFKLKSGIQSPIYLDLRLTISYPDLLMDIAEAISISAHELAFDLLCGVPYTALPFATVFSIQHSIPMVLRRKEKKEYGTSKLIEGVYRPNQRCLIIEDVITSGASILETADSLQNVGLIVQDAIVLVDRQQGGARLLREKNIAVHSIGTLSQIMEVLAEENRIQSDCVADVQTFLLENQL